MRNVYCFGEPAAQAYMYVGLQQVPLSSGPSKSSLRPAYLSQGRHFWRSGLDTWRSGLYSCTSHAPRGLILIMSCCYKHFMPVRRCREGSSTPSADRLNGKGADLATVLAADELLPTSCTHAAMLARVCAVVRGVYCCAWCIHAAMTLPRHRPPNYPQTRLGP